MKERPLQLPRPGFGLFLVFVSALVSLGTNHLHAAAPTLEYIFPAGGQRGTTVSVTLGGKAEPWPVKVWSDSPALQFTPTTNKSVLSVQIPPDATPGPHLLRIYNEEGASETQTFVVGAVPEIAEKEPNDDASKAQVIEKLPVAINGKLEKNGDMDSFAVHVEAGQWLIAQVDAYALGSPVDPFLQLLDPQGVHIADAQDTYNLDPLLVYHVEKSGTYTVQIAGFVHPPQAEVRFTGSASTIYRLTLTDGPFASHAFPPGGQRGHKYTGELHGWNLNGTNRVAPLQLAKLPDNDDESSVHAMVFPPAINAVRFATGEFPEINETEPNNQTNQAQVVTAPCTINGVIGSRGDEDRFRFTAKKDESFEFIARDAALHSPLEAVIRIEGADGKSLARSDTGKVNTDARLTWTAPGNGDYDVVVADLFGQGSDAHVYRLQMAPPQKDFSVATAAGLISLEPGKTNTLKITVTRQNGYAEKLTATAVDLPGGVTVSAMEIPAKGGDVNLAFITADNAMPASQPVRVVVRQEGGSGPRQHFARVDVRGKEPRGDMLINVTEWVWLTVRPKPAPAAEKK